MSQTLNYKDIKKNTILYGPPGTGKTYNTVNYAVTICDQLSQNEFNEKYADSDNSSYDRNKLKQRFNKLKEEGRIEFVTFHQSYGYEDFVEGIRPVLDQDAKDVSYELHEGIFKRICKEALRTVVDSIDLSDNEEQNSKLGNIFSGFDFDFKRNNVWLASSNDKLVEKFLKNDTYFLEDNDGYHDENQQQMRQLNQGDIILLVQGRNQDQINHVISVGKVADQAKDMTIESKHFTREVKWSDNSEFTTTCFSGKELEETLVSDISALIKSKLKKENYVLIIDEINRGNLSKIFGELITLIEDSKRKGQPEEIRTTLPYSNETFSVPDNLYIIGTMNTADRSLAMMDAALRRRFDFVELLPDSNVLSKIPLIEGIDVKKLMEIINARISYLYDSEHMLGQAFFTGLLKKSTPTLEDLDMIFRDTVIPMLKEYFYGDYEKVSQILGGAFVKGQNVFDIEKLFPKNSPMRMSQYFVDESDFGNPDSYQKIIAGVEVNND